jgi:MFS family permease
VPQCFAVGLTDRDQTEPRRWVYCGLWLANVVSNLGVWMQDVGAAWLMPANALVGIIERRRTLLITNVWAPPSVAALTYCTFAGITSPAILFALTFGVGAILEGPALQAVVTELAPRPELASAVA